MAQIFKKLLKLLQKEFFPLCIILFFVFLTSKALFQPGFFRTTDDITTVRIIYLVKELQRNYWLQNFPVRISAELAHGFGYNLYMFYGPLVYYVGAILMMFLKLSHIVATKWVYVFPLLTGPFFCYFALRQKFGRIPSLLGTAIFSFFPFRGYDTYIRGGVGEAWAMAFLPAAIGSLFLAEKKKIGYILFSFFLSLVIISHNISGLLILSFIFVLGLFAYRRKREFWLSLLLTLGLSAFYWLPAAFYLSIVKVTYSNQNTGQVLNFLDPLVNLIRIQIPYNPEGRYSGIFFWIFLAVLTTFVIHIKKIKRQARRDFLFWFFSGVFLYFLLSAESKFIWQLTLPISRLLQFPWRILIILSFIFPFVVAYSISFIKKPIFQVLIFIPVCILVLIFLPSFKPKEYSFFYEYSAQDTGICATTWEDEYLPTWAKECAGGPARQEIEVRKGSFNLFASNKLSYEGSSDASDETELIVYKYYFPGWHVEVDGKSSKLDYTFSKGGIFKTKIPAGLHLIRVYYEKTPVMWIADLISLVSVGLFLLWIARSKHL